MDLESDAKEFGSRFISDSKEEGNNKRGPRFRAVNTTQHPPIREKQKKS